MKCAAEYGRSRSPQLRCSAGDVNPPVMHKISYYARDLPAQARAESSAAILSIESEKLYDGTHLLGDS